MSARSPEGDVLHNRVGATGYNTSDVGCKGLTRGCDQMPGEGGAVGVGDGSAGALNVHDCRISRCLWWRRRDVNGPDLSDTAVRHGRCNSTREIVLGLKCVCQTVGSEGFTVVVYGMSVDVI